MAARELDDLLSKIDPTRIEGCFVFATVNEVPVGVSTFAMVVEDEGITLVLARDEADRYRLDYEFASAMITLGVQSPLAAVGLTAAVSSVLAGAQISCNVIAGRYHDHIFVPIERADEAEELIRALSGNTRP